jgi:hypothetical protein
VVIAVAFRSADIFPIIRLWKGTDASSETPCGLRTTGDGINPEFT